MLIGCELSLKKPKRRRLRAVNIDSDDNNELPMSELSAKKCKRRLEEEEAEPWYPEQEP